MFQHLIVKLNLIFKFLYLCFQTLNFLVVFLSFKGGKALWLTVADAIMNVATPCNSCAAWDKHLTSSFDVFVMAFHVVPIVVISLLG